MGNCAQKNNFAKRKGLAGKRSGLYFEFHRLIASCLPGWVVLENVPGLLSSNEGQDFALVVGGLTGVVPEVPEGGWGNAGLFRGAVYQVAYRVLDAQFFGVSQRRRRVFIVASLGNGRCAEVLFEREGVSGDFEPGRKTGEGVAKTFTIRSGKEGGGKGYLGSDDIGMTLGGQPQWLEPVHPTTYNIQHNDGGEHKRKDRPNGGLYVNETDTALTVGSTDMTAVVMSHGQANAEIVSDGEPSLTQNHEAPTLFQQNQRNEVRNMGDAAGALGAEPGMHNVPMVGVRRLTPTECARLQGFPDDWNDWLSDSARYRQFGNAVAIPPVEWIARRIRMVNDE